jgi:hypothetical protein
MKNPARDLIESKSGATALVGGTASRLEMCSVMAMMIILLGALQARVLLAAGPVLKPAPSSPASVQRHKGVNSPRRGVKNANVLRRGIPVRIPRTQ